MNFKIKQKTSIITILNKAVDFSLKLNYNIFIIKFESEETI